MPRFALVLSSLALAACSDGGAFANIQAAPFLTTGSSGETSGTTAEAPATDGDPPTSTSADTSGGTDGSTSTDADASTSADSSAGTGASASSGGAPGLSDGVEIPPPPPPPRVESIDLPESVHAAGWVPITITTTHASSARLEFDNVEGDPLIEVEPGVWSGKIPIRGAIDNGLHTVRAVAVRHDLEHHEDRHFEVSTPAAGTVALTHTGAPGSKHSQIALTPEGDVLAIGTVTINGVEHPALSKHSGQTGQPLWPAPVLLDDREGQGVDLAVTPAGDVWVAMNVHDTLWRARIALFDADGTSLDVGFENAGRSVQAIAADSKGGCFATGFTTTAEGDQDVLLWRINGELVPTLNSTWDYWDGILQKHSYDDLGYDVVIDGDVVWIVGYSYGKHYKLNPMQMKQARGLVLKLDLQTGTALQPVTIAQQNEQWPQSIYRGAAPYAGGLVVVGQGVDATGTSQRIEISLLSGDGTLTWFAPEPPADVAHGLAVSIDSQGRAIVAGAMRKSNALRGYVYARVLHQPTLVFSHWFSQGGSEARAVTVEPHVDRIRIAGYATVGQNTEATMTYIHP